MKDRMSTAAAPEPLSDADQLLAAARDLAFARDLESVMEIVKTTARAVTGADGVTFVLRDDDQCHYADESAISPLWKGRRFPIESCISGWVMRRGEPVAIDDVFSDPRIPHDAYRQTFVKSLVMVPVRTPDPVAAIGAYWAHRHIASNTQLRALQMLADSAALALSNVRLYQELRSALEQQQQARRDAEAATSAKDDALAIVAHELRQPLFAATSAAFVLRSQPGSTARAQAQAMIERQLLRMTRLIEDLLEASRIVRGEIDLHIRPLSLRELVESAVESARPAVDERHHTLIVSVPDRHATLEGDAGRLEQVLINVIQNAARYTPNGGLIEVTAVADSQQVRISVRDNGEGIAPDRIGEIFGLFTRASATGKSGFGIGLAVSKVLAERHGGSLTARSDGAHQGSEFTLTLPRRQKALHLVPAARAIG